MLINLRFLERLFYVISTAYDNVSLFAQSLFTLFVAQCSSASVRAMLYNHHLGHYL